MSAPGRTLVWIDAREAVVVRRDDDAVVLERIASDVPGHRHSTGHVRHDPATRHGGGGTAPQTAGEPHRLEHLARFVRTVAGRLPAGDDLTIIGPGTVRDHLAQEVRGTDRHHHVERAVTTLAATRQTDRQLVARLERELGHEPRRRTVGAYRWSAPGLRERSGRRNAAPVRVGPKPARAPRDIEQEIETGLELADDVGLEPATAPTDEVALEPGTEVVVWTAGGADAELTSGTGGDGDLDSTTGPHVAAGTTPGP